MKRASKWDQAIIVFLIILFPIKLPAQEKEIFLVVINYIDGLAHTSAPQDCTTFWDYSQDTIIRDMSNYKMLMGIIKELKQLPVIPDSIFCDIRLSAIIMYTDHTYDLICIEGGNYNHACVKYNNRIVGAFPKLTWFLFNQVYDIKFPLYRRLLFGIIDE